MIDVARSLAGRVPTVEAGLVLIAVVVWYAVVTNVSALEERVAITLILCASGVTVVVLLIMYKRSNLLGRSGSSPESPAVLRRLPTVLSRREYAEQIDTGRG